MSDSLKRTDINIYVLWKRHTFALIFKGNQRNSGIQIIMVDSECCYGVFSVQARALSLISFRVELNDLLGSILVQE